MIASGRCGMDPEAAHGLPPLIAKVLHVSCRAATEGRGKVLDASTVEVTSPDGSKKVLKTKNILVAVGGYAVKLDIPGAVRFDCPVDVLVAWTSDVFAGDAQEYGITSDEALALENFPNKDIVILGGGYIAVEFAGIFAGMGANVHLVYRQPTPLRG